MRIFASKCFAFENVGTRRAVSGTLADGEGSGAGAVDGVSTRHAVSVQSRELASAHIRIKMFAYENVGTRRAVSGELSGGDGSGAGSG